MDKQNLPLRIGVGIILLNYENKVFVGRRIDNPKKSWQMPQGGVNENENFLCAAKRELEEETGVKSIKLIKELDPWLKYELPKNLIADQTASFKRPKPESLSVLSGLSQI